MGQLGREQWQLTKIGNLVYLGINKKAIEIIKEYGRFGLDGEEYVFDIVTGKNASEEEIVKAVSLYPNHIRHACIRVSKKMENRLLYLYVSQILRYYACTK